MTPNELLFIDFYESDFVATVVVSMANMEGEEAFDSSLLGQAETVVQERVCDDELIFIKG